MNVHCPYCRQSFNLPREYLAAAVEEAAEQRLKYQTVECVSCRKTIKIPISQMKRFLPRRPPSEEPEEAEAETTEEEEA